MTLFGGIVIYVICWWMVLFAVLPWGNRPPDTPEPGHATSAPEKPRLALKFLVTTGIATVIFLMIWWLMESDLISFRL
jgi:predicted secreted protein